MRWQETFEDASREYAVYVSADGQLLTLESALMAGRRGGATNAAVVRAGPQNLLVAGAADSTVALTLGGAVQTMGGTHTDRSLQWVVSGCWFQGTCGSQSLQNLCMTTNPSAKET